MRAESRERLKDLTSNKVSNDQKNILGRKQYLRTTGRLSCTQSL